MGRSRLSIAGVLVGSFAAILGLGIGRTSPAQSQPTQPQTTQAQTTQPQPTLAAYAPPSQTAPLHTTFVDWDSLTVRQIPQGLSRGVFDNPAPGLDKIELHITTLQPGMTLHAPHHHAWEEMCLVQEGEVQVSINGRKHRVGPGCLVFFASHDAHSIENASDKPATYVVMNLCAASAHTTPDKPAAEQRALGKLPSSVFDCNSAPATPSATGSTTLIFDSPTTTFTKLKSQITTLALGQSTHSDTLETEHELYFVKSGMLEVTVNGISCRTSGGSLFYCGPNEKPTLKNIGSTPAAYQIIQFTPAPAKAN